MNNNLLDKILINWLASYKADFLDDLVLRGIVSRFEDNKSHANWIAVFNAAQAAYLKRPNKNEFSAPRDFLTPTIIKRMIETATRDCPVVDLSSGAKVMGEVLDLTSAEQKMLDFAIQMENCSYCYREAFENFRFHESNAQTDNLYAILLGVGEDDIRKVREGFLCSIGLVHWGESMKSYPQLHNDMAETLSQEDLTIETLAEDLFPSSMSSNLTIDNFTHLSDEISLCENIINNSLTKHSLGVNVMFWGNPGCGKSQLALVLARKNDWNLIVVGDYGNRNSDREKSRAQRLTSLKVALKLYGGSRNEKTVILFDECEDLVKIDLHASQSKAFINRILENAPCPIIMTTNSLEPFDQAFLRRMKYNIEFESPPTEMRAKMWKHYRDVHGAEISDEQIDDFANDFKIAPALIENSVEIAKASGATGKNLTSVVTSLERLVNYGAKQKKEVKARTDIPYDISFINSPTDMVRMTEKIVKVTKGFSMLLWGHSGTGKSEYARHVAKLMGKKIVFRKASDILGMYLGESEKNLAAAFEEAREEDRALIVDECDSFLRDRAGAQRGYEVSITNELLSQLETADFPVFMTTNLFDCLDQAVLRRFTFRSKFDFATPAQADRMFNAYFGKAPPPDIMRMENLTAGDFAVVSQRATILNVDDPVELFEMLVEESDQKQVKGNRMGF